MVEPSTTLTDSERRLRFGLVAFAFILFSVLVLGLTYLATTPAQTVTLTLSYTAGLSMIVLPCTLPLVFVIVPLCMGQSYRQGFIMALLFGLGLTVTLTLYANVVALVGSWLGMDQATRFMLVVAGLAAWIFGLGELGYYTLKLPTYTGGVPRFIIERQDYLKAFLMGLFLGNAGVACPNPAFYVLLTHIATVGEIGEASLLGSIHGLGRATPLIFLAILGMLGVNATQAVIKRKVAVEKAIGWGLIIVGSIILTMGLFGHHWLLVTGLHEGWTRLLTPPGVAEYACCIEPVCKECLTNELFPNNTCQCRFILEQGLMDRICGECMRGLAQGKGVFDMARRTAPYASAMLATLLLLPIGWALWRRFFSRIDID
ncbi:MAG: cytochrome C biogenesis protein [Gammaproteobacteria bacterium]|nr:cytochrome C biogenesis protein [Gammaproteobacteria bacterium]